MFYRQGLSHAKIGTGPKTDERDKVGGTTLRSEGILAMVQWMRVIEVRDWE
jgi:hypothetical protein